jgi:hypothetical protein
MVLENFPLLNAKACCFIPQGKLVQLLRNVQTEQFSKLQQRYQLQIDLLEEVRYYFPSFTVFFNWRELRNMSVFISGHT